MIIMKGKVAEQNRYTERHGLKKLDQGDGRPLHRLKEMPLKPGWASTSPAPASHSKSSAKRSNKLKKLITRMA
jgi:hypothetical protein